jgi:proteic killer suppression protein
MHRLPCSHVYNQREIWPTVRRKLDYMQAVTRVDQLRYPPGSRREALKGSRRGLLSVRVNDQYRLTFKFERGHASEVRCEDVVGGLESTK